MPIKKEARAALESIVGPEYITEDRVICEAYTNRGFDKETGLGKPLSKTPECIILPGSTGEVQKIVKICNRYRVPYVPAGSYWMIHCQPKFPGSILIDLKRMDELVIDEKNMYAVVGPGLIYSPLQEKAMRVGLYTVVPGGGSQAAVIPNHLHWGLSPLGYRIGLANRRILGVEWVLPDGELLKLGSLATGDDPFWGEGPGPDLRGLLRGWVGWNGGLGVVTRMATKLVPFQPEKLRPVGISPDTALELPSNRVKWYNFKLPGHDELVKAMHEIGRAGIAAGVTRVPIMWRYIAKAKSREEFWEEWRKPGKKEEVENTHILRVLIIGYASEEQLKYEERVLHDIISELGGTHLRTRNSDESWFKNADAVTMWFMTGGFCSTMGLVETITCAVKARERLTELKHGYTPPLMEDYGDMGWYQVSEFGHNGYLEFLTYFDPDDDMEKIDRWVYYEAPKEDIKSGTYNIFQLSQSALHLSGPAFGPNYHIWMLKIKGALDPNGLSNPPAPQHVDQLFDEAPWLKALKDW